MNTFNSDNYFLTSNEKFDTGILLASTERLDIYDHIQATIYYEHGITEIDNKLNGRSYIDLGYVCSITSRENSIEIWFYKFGKNQILEDMAVAFIERKNIIDFEKIVSDNLPVVKREEAKHKMKYMARNSGIIGRLGSIATDKIISANIEILPGTRYNLNFYNKNNIPQQILFYSSHEFDSKTTLFLNTYYKNILPEEAKTPLQPSSSCYIATACYKDYFSIEVINLRWYRDNILNKTSIGRLFIRIYYKVSPRLFNSIFQSTFITNSIRKLLNVFVNNRIKILKDKQVATNKV